MSPNIVLPLPAFMLPQYALSSISTYFSRPKDEEYEDDTGLSYKED